MTGEALLVALRRTNKQITVIHDRRLSPAKFTPDQALQVIQMNPACWHGSGTKRRISAIEFRPPAPKRLEWQDCWLTTDAAVLRFPGIAA